MSNLIFHHHHGVNTENDGISLIYHLRHGVNTENDESSPIYHLHHNANTENDESNLIDHLHHGVNTGNDESCVACIRLFCIGPCQVQQRRRSSAQTQHEGGSWDLYSDHEERAWARGTL